MLSWGEPEVLGEAVDADTLSATLADTAWHTICVMRQAGAGWGLWTACPGSALAIRAQHDTLLPLSPRRAGSPYLQP